MMVALNASNNTYHTGPSLAAMHTYFAFLGFLALLIFLVNFFVIFLYLNRCYLRTITNLCLVFLATSDLLTSLVVIPLVLACNILPTERFICLSSDLAARFIAISTILHLMIVSLERYVMIVFPMKYIKIINKTRVILALAVVWCFSLTVALIQFSWILQDESPYTSLQINKADLTYSLTTYFGIVVPVFLLLVSTYAHTFLVLRHQVKNIIKNVPALLEGNQRRQTRHEKYAEARAVVIFAVMLFTFVCGWFPYFIVTILHDLRIDVYMSFEASVVLIFMRYGTSLVNPLLYTFLKTDFRRALPRFRATQEHYQYTGDTRQNEPQL